MNPIRYLLFILIISLTLNGCATLDKDECSTANWELIGLGDGHNGYKITRLDQHRQACAEYKVVPDVKAYNKGRDRGLLKYCRASNGYDEGISGAKYAGVCPAKLEPAFLDAYRYGSKLYSLKSDITDLEAKLAQAQESRRRLETDAQHNRFVIDNKRNTPETRARLTEQLRQLDQAIGKLTVTIQQLRESIRIRTDEFRKMKSFNPYR